MANYRAHYEWNKAKGTLHDFVAAAGTGGTIAVVSRYLKVCMLFNLFILYNLLSDKHLFIP
jgi:hypothetical protein